MTQPPPNARECTQNHHPERNHGHYGPGGRYWCSDFGSPLLSEGNGGVIERGWVVIFAKKSGIGNLDVLKPESK